MSELKAERQEAILRAASAVFRDKGLRASLQDIADELGITYNALYYYAKNRDDLILQCLLRTAGLLQQSIEASDRKGGTGLEKVLRFLREFIALGRKERTPPGVLSIALSVEAQLALYESTIGSSELLGKMIDEGIADGSITPTDSLVATTWILHMLYWWPHELDTQRDQADIADTIVSLIRRSLTQA